MENWILAGKPLGGRTGHEAGLELLEELYRRVKGGPLPEIRRTERGKPYFADSPLHFSISHTKSHAFCVLSTSPVGVDAEEQDRQVSPKLAEKILSPGELAQYRQAADGNEALLRFWVLKEALVKCTGQGLRGYPDDTDFSMEDPRIQQKLGCFVAVITEK